MIDQDKITDIKIAETNHAFRRFTTFAVLFGVLLATYLLSNIGPNKATWVPVISFLVSISWIWIQIQSQRVNERIDPYYWYVADELQAATRSQMLQELESKKPGSVEAGNLKRWLRQIEETMPKDGQSRFAWRFTSLLSWISILNCAFWIVRMYLAFF